MRLNVEMMASIFKGGQFQVTKDVESSEQDSTFCGEIADIRVEDDKLVVDVAWAAVKKGGLPYDGNPWTKSELTQYTVNLADVSIIFAQGRERVSLGFYGNPPETWLFVTGEILLDPGKVPGLGHSILH